MITQDIHSLLPDADRAKQVDDAMHAHLESRLLRMAERLVEDVSDIGETLTGLAGLIASGRRVPSLAFAFPDQLEAALLAGDAEGARAVAARLAGLPARTLRRPLLVAGAADAAPLLAVLAEDADPALHLTPVPAAEAASFAAGLAQASVLMGAHLPELRAESDLLVQEIMLGHRQPGAAAQSACGTHDRYWGLLVIDPAQYRTPLSIIEMLARETAQALLCGLSIDARTADGGAPAALSETDEAFRAAVASARVAWSMDRIAGARDVTDEDREAAARAAQTARAALGPDHDAQPDVATEASGGSLGSTLRMAIAGLALPLSA